MTRERNAKATKQRIFETAERLFVERGYDGASVDDIATQADVNKRMLYVYFSNKEGLYVEVLRDNIRRALDATHVDVAVDADPREQMVAFIRKYFSFMVEHPRFVKLVGWEFARDGRLAGRILLEMASSSLEPLHQLVRRGVTSGVFREGLNPRTVVMTIDAVVAGYFNRKGVLEALEVSEAFGKSHDQEILESIIELLFYGIMAAGKVTADVSKGGDLPPGVRPEDTKHVDGPGANGIYRTGMRSGL